MRLHVSAEPPPHGQQRSPPRRPPCTPASTLLPRLTALQPHITRSESRPLSPQRSRSKQRGSSNGQHTLTWCTYRDASYLMP